MVGQSTPIPLNPHLQKLDVDNFYHLGFDSSMDLSAFSKVRWVCMGGSADRAGKFAALLAGMYGKEEAIQPCGKSERGIMYLVGDVISMSHGMGMPSCLIFIHEIVKLLHYAKADLQKVEFIRIGTSGGIGVPGGQVVVTSEGLDATLTPGFLHTSCGIQKRFEARSNDELVRQLVKHGGGVAIAGKTIGTDDFYEGQSRLDGAILPWYDESDKMAFLQRAADAGVKNIEMEAPAFLSFFQRLNLKAAIICCSLLDRLHGDTQFNETREELAEYSTRTQNIVLRYLAEELGLPAPGAERDNPSAERARKD
eukprot:GEMP01060891.1.p1 GENE.GEMP01060891.1~~GEMP01060891.1.p1  ORF type:complete len:310 (+),score=85.89 GEMP01060891.1:72-1001(+)